MVAERKQGVQKKRVDKSGLGKAIINRRARQAKIAADPTLHVKELANGLSSVTQENDLDEFLNTAQLADHDFTAERNNTVKVISAPNTAAGDNPFLLTPQQERELAKKHADNVEALQVPRRPHWTRDMTVIELEKQEREAFVNWRRELAELQDNKSLLLTPFERNIEVWRQLWRTLERSQLVVQIVDARNPLAFLSADLFRYVDELNDKEMDEAEEKATADDKGPRDSQDNAPADSQGTGPTQPRPRKKTNLLLINKSDLLTQRQRAYWADYLEAHGIEYVFFSAANATALQEERRVQQEKEDMLKLIAQNAESDEGETSDEEREVDDVDDVQDLASIPFIKLSKAQQRKAAVQTAAEAITEKLSGLTFSKPDEPARTRIVSVLELEDIFLREAPKRANPEDALTVGLVGYPNVGKSSTINALIGEKKVSVSATPGKTKHFQTIQLSKDVTLCDCPGLVFPQFAKTQADLVCDGVLPIDQLREHTGPVSLVTQRIPKHVLEGVYGLRIKMLPEEAGGSGVPTAAELLSSYAIARGYFTSGVGNTDNSRAARFILKDYVTGHLLYCIPPPGIDGKVFNEETHDLERLKELGKLRSKLAPLTRVPINSDTFVSSTHKKGGVDNAFFDGSNSQARVKTKRKGTSVASDAFTRVKMYPHQRLVANDGTLITNALASSDISPNNTKRHFKDKRSKQRSGNGNVVE